jgi:CIC family chloride channel protein
VLVCELAGGYDLLVTLMLAEGIALVAPRKKSL